LLNFLLAAAASGKVTPPVTAYSEMSVSPDASVFVRIASLSAQALAEDGAVKTEEFLAACSEVLPIVGALTSHLATELAAAGSGTRGMQVALANGLDCGCTLGGRSVAPRKTRRTANHLYGLN
jgi:hypothetical protein